ncbi:MAG: tetratricopeptide repeat protein [Spirochaetales bacterium]|jgi:Ca-activated chloride channel family protein|nr:tetratricopeptide repeat protein [Spirochaetales bacterium]
MVKKPLPLCLCFSALGLLFSCGEFRASYQVVRGNYNYLRGDYQQANIRYLEASEWEGEPEIIAYNLGTVYQALGETRSAQEQWQGIDPGDNKVLAYNLLYNRGIVDYQTGNYQGAYEAFRQALILDPTSLNAKINLEHALRKLNVAEQETSQAPAPVPRPEENSEEVQRILDYLRRIEPVQIPRSPARQNEGVEDW